MEFYKRCRISGTSLDFSRAIPDFQNNNRFIMGLVLSRKLVFPILSDVSLRKSPLEAGLFSCLKGAFSICFC